MCNFYVTGNPDILICGNCREMFTDLGELLEHKRNYCKLRFTCKCHTFNGTAPSTYLLERKVCPANLPLPLYSVVGERKRSRLLVRDQVALYQTGLYEFHSYVSAFKKFFNKDPAFIEIRGRSRFRNTYPRLVATSFLSVVLIALRMARL